MSDDLEARILDLELRFGNFLSSTAEKLGEIHRQTAESADQTAAVVTLLIEELVAEGVLDGGRLHQRVEAHASHLGEAGRFGTRRIVVDQLLMSLQRSRRSSGPCSN
ncbi:hypothetical protein [Methylobacterium gnaphalii]|uniref:hypothetical protein n=1 Tax=Methylobacterium gnaphalii TaxID=1010610 RepID=UPI0011BD44E4|nr:hypothetical protein [Methylobacterium gnaphalii]